MAGAENSTTSAENPVRRLTNFVAGHSAVRAQAAADEAALHLQASCSCAS